MSATHGSSGLGHDERGRFLPSLLIPDDLAPGDRRALHRDWSDEAARRIRDVDDPDFAPVYERLWEEFGASGGMEPRSVIEERLRWDPSAAVGPYARAYEMWVVRRSGEVAALRDHSVAIRLDAAGGQPAGPVVVHLSHALVLPAHRGSGLAAWLRALPLQVARRAMAAARVGPGTEIVLAAEMEPLDPREPGTGVRLRSYGRAGFSMVDPTAVSYAQPDFRSPEELAGSTPRTHPYALVLRRVGRESENAIPAAELAAVVDAIYAIYGAHVPAAALDPLGTHARIWTARHATFRLLPPAG